MNILNWFIAMMVWVTPQPETAPSRGREIECTHREYCYWNPETLAYGDCEKEKEETRFVIAADNSLITHYTESMNSRYYVVEHYEDVSKNVEIFAVVSDAENEYVFMIDPAEREVRIAAEGSDGVPYQVKFKMRGKGVEPEAD